MTRRDYELLANVFARTRPNPDTDPERYTQWAYEVVTLCDELEKVNKRFDRQLFQYNATNRVPA